MVEMLAIAMMVGLLGALTIPHMVRARSFKAQDVCINNLRKIDSAKEQWAIDFRQIPSVTPAFEDVRLFIRYTCDNSLPVCPLDLSGTFQSSYRINALTSAPVCLVNPTNHVLL
jgi:hypothetical protein